MSPKQIIERGNIQELQLMIELQNRLVLTKYMTN